MIIRGELGRPGDPLLDLAWRCGVSDTTMRAILADLAAEGLVVRHGHGRPPTIAARRADSH